MSQTSAVPDDQPRDAVLRQHQELLEAFDLQFGDAVQFDEEIRGSDAVDWISQFAPLVRNLLAGGTPEQPCVAVCNVCGGRDISAEAIATWDTTQQRWAVSSVIEGSHYCEDCDGQEVGAIFKLASEVTALVQEGG